MVSKEYIMSLDIPESDKVLLKRFRTEDWANICPERCESELAKEEARWMERDARAREEYSCGID